MKNKALATFFVAAAAFGVAPDEVLQDREAARAKVEDEGLHVCKAGGIAWRHMLACAARLQPHATHFHGRNKADRPISGAVCSTPGLPPKYSKIMYDPPN